MNIRQQALEAARPHASDIEDLLTKAAKIEAYLLGSTSLTPPSLGPITDTATNESVEINPRPFDHRFCAFPAEPDGESELDADVREMLAISKALAESNPEFQLSENDLAAGESWVRRQDQETIQKLKMKSISEAVENCDLFSAPPPPVERLGDERLMENFKTPVRSSLGLHNNFENTHFEMRPKQLEIGSIMENEHVVLNMCRRFGTTTMIAAFARQQQARGHKVLILTNNHGNSSELELLIDDSSVEVMTFQYAARRTHAGEHYDHIIVDNAAFIPYAQEPAIRDYIDKCMVERIRWELRTYAPGFTSTPTKLALISVPGRKFGWFYTFYTDTEGSEHIRRMAIDWKSSPMTAEEADRLRKEVGEMIFRNQFENQFRDND